MSNIVVEIHSGKVKGTTAKDYYGGSFYKFLGIPYAKSPIGQLRFKAPQPIEPWAEVKDATREGPECPSSDMYFTYYIGNEDNCLNLNVYTKELPENEELLKKPVMFWVHGGAFTTGSSKPAMFGPDYLLTQDIVLVTSNYRLGVLGFASFKDRSLEVPGNAGLKDMRMALKWVKQNIDKFGGDPDNVTIFGESAGAASVHYLTLAPSTRGLFHKAIIQSGSALNSWSWGTNNSLIIAKALGYKENDEKIILDKLLNESSRSLVSGQRRLRECFSAGEIRPYGPVVEPPSPDAILTEHPSKTMHFQGGHKIPVIIGYNSNEGLLFELVRRSVPGVGIPQDLEQEIPFELGLEKGSEKAKAIADRLRKEYFNDNDPSENEIEQVYKLKGDANFVHAIHRMLKLQAKHSNQPVYAYRMTLRTSLNYFYNFALNKYFKTALLCCLLSKASMNYLPSLQETLQEMLRKLPKHQVEGVSHADDVYYLFSTFFTPPIKPGSEEDKHIQKFVKMWTNFARYGDPTPQTEEHLDQVKWKPVVRDNLEFLDIGQELKMTGNLDEDRLKVWDEIYEAHYRI